MDRYGLYSSNPNTTDMECCDDGEYVYYLDALKAIAAARDEALREAADRAVCRMIDAGMVSCTRQASLLRSAILSDKQEPK